MRKTVRRIGGLLLLVNLILAIIKTGAWYYTGSIALKAEALNSVVDSVYSAIIVTGIYASTKKPNEKYPEGYKRIEPFVSLLISLGILITSSYLIYQSINVEEQTHNITNTPIAIVIIAITIIVKIFLYKLCIKKSDETSSPALYAAGIDNRNDVLTISLAFVGILGAIININTLDIFAAVIISLVIGYSGIEIARENIGYMIGRSPSRGEREAIKRAAEKHPEVHGIHDFCTHYSGPTLDVSLHLEVEGGKTIEEGHQIEIEVADKIREITENKINEINIHIDPKTLNEWENKNRN